MIARDQDRECHCRLHEPLPGQDATLSDGDRKLIADVLNHGWHLVQIPDDSESPGWVFSVGMWHSLGSPELAVFGMGLNDAGNLINHIGARIRSGTAIGPEVVLDDLLEPDRPLGFRMADTSWYRALFGYAMWFGRRPPLPVAQVVWADAHGRFLWDEGIDDWYRQSQPMLWLRPIDHPDSRWRVALMDRT